MSASSTAPVLAYVSDEPGSELSVPVAAALADARGAPLEILYLYAPVPIFSIERAIHRVAADSWRADEASSRRRLEELAPRARISAVPVAPGLSHAPIIVEESEQQGASVIVKAASGQGRVGQPLFGGTALQLIRSATVPVWLATGPFDAHPDRILTTLLQRADEGADPADVRALRTGAGLARALGAAFEAVCFWEAPEEGLLRRYMPSEQILRSLRQVRWNARRCAQRAMDLAGAQVDRLHLLRGDPRDVLPRRRGTDLLVLGTECPRGFARLVRDLPEDIVNRWDGPVLTVPPAGDDDDVEEAA